MTTMTNTKTPAEVAQSVTGSKWTTEQTGGGCLALTTRLEGGYVLAVTDDAMAQLTWQQDDAALMGWAVSVYREDVWTGQHDDTDPVVTDWFNTPLTPARLTEALRTTLNALPTLLGL